MALLHKSGFPEEGELVMCSVTSVQFHSVFCQLDEYNSRTGMIHISEVAPGRIRNIRDFVKEGKKVVCKVLKIHLDRGHIDLSLRRVTEIQKRQKVDELKQQQNAEKILEHVAKGLAIKPEEFFARVYPKAIAHAQTLYSFFQDVSRDNAAIDELGLNDKEKKALLEIILQRVKIPEVMISGSLKLQSYASDGIEKVKGALHAGLKATQNRAEVRYLGSGMFHISVKSPDYKSAEKILDTFVTSATDFITSAQGSAEFVRAQA